jgi:hypothetical protein
MEQGLCKVLQDFGTNLMNDPLKQLETGMGSFMIQQLKLIKA